MRVHYLQHVVFEGLGSIDSWLRKRGMEVTGTCFAEDFALPDLEEVDGLIAMGGPMSVHDEQQYPWLRAEKRFLREALARDKRILGICLGAQLIADVLGARVYPNRAREVGWHPIVAVPQPAVRSAFRLPAQSMAFHWHGETFDLPRHALHLARSEACENQAFQIGEKVIGLQFHLETTVDSAQKLVANCRADLQPGPWVQSEEVILAAPADRYLAANALMEQVLLYLTETRHGG